MWVDDYQWHYDYIRLAWDTGFSFEKCKNPNLDKNQIGIADVDHIVKERDVATVDRYISTVVQYILEDEQAKVLDFNFVKIFRLSQLAVEYLLFCKKYLDNTVILLKKELAKNKDETKDLKTYISELESHLDSISKHQALSTYKCTTCLKAFSSEDYLNSHIKRRHENPITQNNAETDKLNTEIKELKERLNAAEKLLKENNDQVPEKSMLEKDNTSSKVSELLDKFEQFKSQVDVELKDLKLQKSFYEQNYGKLFDIVVQNKENVEPLKSETAIQTDRVLNIETVINKNVLEIKDVESSSGSTNKANNVELIQEAIENKMASSLAGIENQMQTFWEKLVQIEQNKNKEPVIMVGDSADVKPRVKPRSKFTNTAAEANNKEDREKLRRALEELENKQEELIKKEAKVVEPRVKVKRELKKGYSVKESSESESSESESDSEESSCEDQSQEEVLESCKKEEKRLEISSKPAPLPVKTKSPSKRPLVTEKRTHQQEIRSAKKVPLPSLQEVTRNIENTVTDRLQELGISPKWRRLPVRSYEKALEIINHQALLSKKNYPNFDKIKKKIQTDIDKQSTQNKSQLEMEVNTTSPKIKKLQNIVRVSYRPKTGKKSAAGEQRLPEPPSPKHTLVPEIKNRSLYDTDTESDQQFKTNQKSDILPVYSQVVREFKSNFINEDSSDVEKPHKKPSPRDGQKGVLKNYPSVNSLSKKKVFFDLESAESSKIDDVPINQKTGGSTTSIASSILGEKVESPREVREEKKKKKEKDLEELSDFDLSELQ